MENEYYGSYIFLSYDNIITNGYFKVHFIIPICIINCIEDISNNLRKKYNCQSYTTTTFCISKYIDNLIKFNESSFTNYIEIIYGIEKYNINSENTLFCIVTKHLYYFFTDFILFLDDYIIRLILYRYYRITKDKYELIFNVYYNNKNKNCIIELNKYFSSNNDMLSFIKKFETFKDLVEYLIKAYNKISKQTKNKLLTKLNKISF